MTVQYKGKTVCCCCANCLNARGEISGKIKCAEDGKFHHPMDECARYEFSWKRFEDGGEKEAVK